MDLWFTVPGWVALNVNTDNAVRATAVYFDYRYRPAYDRLRHCDCPAHRHTSDTVMCHVF